MSAKQKAVDDIKKLGRMLKGMIDVAEELEQMGSLEQAHKEAVDRVESFKSVEAKAKCAMSEAEASLAAVCAKASEVEANATATAQAILKDAHEQADGVINSANADATAALKAASIKKGSIELECIAARNELVSVQTKIVGEQAVLDDLRKQLTALRERLGV